MAKNPIIAQTALSALLFSACLALCGCGKSRESITLAGSTAFQPFAAELAQAYMAKRPDVVISVQGGGSALGVQSALSGAAQIGMADLVKLPPEAAALSSVVAARDGICLVVHVSNPVKSLLLGQIRSVFNGEIRNWKDAGGPDSPITVVSREAGSGTRSSFEDIVGGVKLTRDAIIQDSSGTIRETVANDENAIGYISHGVLNEKVKAISVDGKCCGESEIASDQYKLVRPVFLLTKGPPAGLAKDFITFVLSEEGQNLIRKNGLLPAR